MNEQPTTEKLSWYQRNKDKALANQKKLYQVNKETRKEYAKEHFKNNIDTYRMYSKKYCDRDKHKRLAYTKRRIEEDPVYACRIKLCSSISCSATRAGQKLPFYTRFGFKQSELERILGCTIEQFVAYFESLFQPGMTWANHGEWHIDHIKPVATANTIEEVERLNYYTNLQPLWSADNIAKGSTFEGVRVRRAKS